MTQTTRPRHKATRVKPPVGSHGGPPLHDEPACPGDKAVLDDYEAELSETTAGAEGPDQSWGLIGRLGDHVRDVVADPVSHWDPEYICEKLLPVMQRVNRYYDGEVSGLANVPDRPALLVGNHSGGLVSPDTGILLENWYRRFGAERRLALLTFDLAMAIPGFGDLCRKLGSLPAGHDAAEAALASGASVMVYPGGDYEVFRPFWHRNHIDFGGRNGFIRLALRTGVPVVPVVSHGGHHTMTVLTRGDGFARAMKLDRVRTKVFPFALGGPLGVTPAFLKLPLPAKIEVRILEPIDFSALGPDAADDPEVVAACFEEVTGRMQASLTAMAKETPFPVLSRIGSLFRRN